MKSRVDINQWIRKDQFHFFKEYDDPFFSITANVDIGPILEYAREEELSTFVVLLYVTLRAANEVDEFRYRIEDGIVYTYDTIHAGCTILNENKTFGFCYFDYDINFRAFLAGATAALKRYRSKENKMEAADERHDLIHYSVMPWVHFSSITHARRLRTGDSIPKVVMGKYIEEESGVVMPLSLDAHHALMDGFHVGEYFQRAQAIFQAPQRFLE